MKIFLILIFTSVLLYSCSNESTQPTGNNNTAAYTQIDFDPVLNSDKDTLVYINSNVNFKFTGMYSFDILNGFNKQLVNAIVRTPDISNIDSKIVYSLNGQLAVMDPDGMNSQIINGNVNSIYPKWSNDGNRILYENSDCLTGCGIRIINSDGTGDSLIIPKGRSPDWSIAANEFIYLVSQEGGNGDSLFNFNMNTGVRTLIKVLNLPEHKSSQYLNFVGGAVIFCSTSETGYSYVYKLTQSIGIVEKLALNQGWSPYYSESNSMIYYTNRDEGNGRIWIMDLNGNGNRQYNEIYK